MRTTTVSPHMSRGRLRVAVALPAAVVLAFGIAACGSQDDTDEQNTGAGTSNAVGRDGAAAAGEDTAPDGEEPAPEGQDDAVNNSDVELDGNNPDQAGSADDAPGLSNAELLLNEGDFPGMQYQVISAEETEQAIRQFQQLAATVAFDPPECADATSVTASLPEGSAMANVIDEAGNVAFTIGVLGTGVNTREFADQNQRCATVTLSGAGISGTTNTSQVQGPRINGANVQAFDVRSTSRVEALNQEQTQAVTNYQVTTRGVTFRVAATQLQADISPDVRAQLDDIANRQAEKIRNA